MILQRTYVEPKVVPQMMDNLIAARVTSLITALAGLEFLGSPILYFGVSEQPVAYNYVIVGMLILSCAATRLVWPRWTTVASWVNAVLGVWILLSPWLFSYSNSLGPWINSLVIGSVVVGYSIFSASFTRHLPRYPNDTLADERQVLGVSHH